MAQKPSDNPRINKLIELEVSGRIKPEHQQELDTYRAQGFAPKKSVGSATESERTAAFLGTRVAGAMGTLAEVDQTDPDAAKPRLGPEIVKMLTPERFEDAAANAVTPESRQRVEAAQLELLDAALTLGTGAAYTREQLEGYRRSYFPQMGDDPGTIADKRQRLKVVLEAAKVKAGSAAPSIDQALAKAYGGAPPPAPPQPATSTTDTLQVGTNPIEDAVERAAGPSQADNQAAFEAAFRDAYAKGADRAALLAIGSKFGVQANEQELDAALAARARGDARLNIARGDGGTPAGPATPPEGRGGGGIGEAIAAGARGVADTATLGFLDEIGAGLETWRDPDSTLRQNLDEQRAIDRYDEENNFGARLTGQVLGGAGLPMGVARTPAALGRAGAAYGAAYGFGSGEGMADRAGGALTGGVAGGALAYGAGRGIQALQARRLARGAVNDPTPAQALGAAAERQGVRLPPALVGGPVTRQSTAVFAQTPGGIAPISGAAERLADDAGAALGRIAQTAGTPMAADAAGEVARRGAITFINSGRARAKALYDKARTLAGDTPVDMQLARAALDEHIAELAQVPGGEALLPKLQTLRADLNKPASVAGVRGLRTVLRNRFLDGGAFLSGNDERIIGDIVSAASDDVMSALRGAGKEDAARAFSEADRFYRQRAEIIEQTIQPIIGTRTNPKSGEQVIAAINTAAKGNAQRLEQFMRALPADEAGIVRATIIDRLGKARAGGQDDVGEVFSLETFLTRWNEIETGRKALFDPATRSALDDLAKIAAANRDAGRYLNTSKTGGVVVGALTFGSGFGSLPFMAAALSSQYAAGKLLASPRFARWLARMPKARDPKAHVDGLSDIASKEAALAPEILNFQQRLTAMLDQEVARAGAADQNNGLGPEQQE